MKKSKKKIDELNIIDIILKITLVLVIILLLLTDCSMFTKEEKEKPKTPTGNIDIFEIKSQEGSCTKDSEITKSIDQEDENINTGYSKKKTKKYYDDEPEDYYTEEIEDANITVSDNKKIWESSNDIEIFKNQAYDMQQKIAPGSSNTYQFMVKNNSGVKVKYELSFAENNPHNINMKYRLKKQNTYIVGDDSTWVSYNELSKSNLVLNASNSDLYNLEWKWVSSDNDTNAANIKDAYSLTITIGAESINE